LDVFTISGIRECHPSGEIKTKDNAPKVKKQGQADKATGRQLTAKGQEPLVKPQILRALWSHPKQSGP